MLGFSIFGPEQVQFFTRSPFGWRQNDIDRNQDSVVFQATFLGARARTHAPFMSDINYEQIEKTSKRHKAAGTSIRCLSRPQAGLSRNRWPDCQQDLLSRRNERIDHI
jgi:hypothetical protein